MRNLFFIVVCLLFIKANTEAQDSSGIVRDKGGNLVLPSNLSKEEFNFIRNDDRFFSARGVPFDLTTNMIYGRPASHMREEIKRVSAKIELTNLMDKAWTVMLFKQGIISQDDAKRVLDALIKSVNAKNRPGVDPSGEFLLKEILGEKHKELSSIPQIGRTLQEPMARMQLREKQLDVIDGTHHLLEVILNLSEKHKGTIMPGMTHMAHGQITTYGAYLLAFYDGIARTLEYLELAYNHTNENSGGAGALGGSGWNVDRQLVTELLGFDKLAEPAYDAEAGQDYAMSTLFALSNMLLVESRVAMDHEIWGMDGYYTHVLDDDHKGVSSFMPQKAHSGSAWEFIRITGNNVIGAAMTGVLGLHGEPFQDVLPTYQAAYKTPSHGAIGALAETEMIHTVEADMFSTINVDKAKLFKLAKEGWGTIPDLAAFLAQSGEYSRRQAHHIAAIMVRLARDHRHILPTQLTGDMLDEAADIAQLREPNMSTSKLQSILDPENSLERHDNVGGPNPAETVRMINIRKNELEISKHRQEERRQRVQNGYAKLHEEVNRIINH